MSDLNGNEQMVSQEQMVSPNVVSNEQMVSPPVGILAQPEAVLSSEPSQGLDDFRKYLADDVRAHPALANFKDINGLAKSYLGQMQIVGRRFEDLTPEQLDMFYNKQGRPETPAGYEIANMPADDPIAVWYKETAHKLGLTQKAAGEMFQAFGGLVNEHRAKEAARQQEVSDTYIKQMQQEYGPAFDERIQLAQRAVREFGGAELQQLLSNPMFGDHPAIVRAFSEMGKRLVEHTGVRGQSIPFKLSSEEAANEITNLNRDPEFMKAYLDHRHPGHNEAVLRKQNLYNIAYEG